MVDVHKYQHNEKRKVVAQALTGRALDAMAEVLARHTRIFCKVLSETQSSGRPAKDWGSPCDVHPIVRQLTFDIMGDVCFGNSFDTMTSSGNHYIFRAMKQGGRCLYAVCLDVCPGSLILT